VDSASGLYLCLATRYQVFVMDTILFIQFACVKLSPNFNLFKIFYLLVTKLANQKIQKLSRSHLNFLKEKNKIV